MNKDELKKYLTTPKNLIKLKELKPIFLKKTGIRGQYQPLTGIEHKYYALLLSYYDYNPKKVMEYIAKIRKNKFGSVNQKIGKTIRQILSFFDEDELSEEREERKKGIDKFNREKGKITSKVKAHRELLSFFSIKTDGLEKVLKKIEENGEQDTTSYLKQLYELRALFLAKAKGEITTRQTEVLWEVEQDKETGKIYKTKPYQNSKGKSYITEKTQSHLPDEKALVGVKIIDELILEVESRENTEITEEELKQYYLEVQKKTQQEREEFFNRVLEAEVIDDAEQD